MHTHKAYTHDTYQKHRIICSTYMWNINMIHFMFRVRASLNKRKSRQTNREHASCSQLSMKFVNESLVSILLTSLLASCL